MLIDIHTRSIASNLIRTQMEIHIVIIDQDHHQHYAQQLNVYCLE